MDGHWCRGARHSRCSDRRIVAIAAAAAVAIAIYATTAAATKTAPPGTECSRSGTSDTDAGRSHEFASILRRNSSLELVLGAECPKNTSGTFRRFIHDFYGFF